MSADPQLHAVPDPDDEGVAGQAAPHDVAAEQQVLGALMLDPKLVDGIAVQPGEFYLPKHTAIFETILGLASTGEPTDPQAVVARLADKGALVRVGGTGYVHTLVSELTATASAGWYASRVRTLAHRRQVIETGTRIVQLGHQAQLDSTEAATLAQELTAGLDPDTAMGPRRWLDILVDTLKDVEEAAASTSEMRGISTGLSDLDAYLNGLQPGQLIVLGARPRIGKTVLAGGFARAAALHRDIPTALFSLEMPAVEMAKRILAAELRIPLTNLISGQLGDDEWVDLARAVGGEGAPLHLDDTPGRTLADIRATARSLKRNGGLGLVIVDYLQLVQSRGRAQNREQEVSALSRGFKLLARELGVPVVVCAQLNRGSEMRADKRPQLADLRESGAVEQDADVVLLLHRDDAYDEHDRPGEVDVIVAKNRNGRTGTVPLISQLHFARFMQAEMHV